MLEGDIMKRLAALGLVLACGLIGIAPQRAFAVCDALQFGDNMSVYTIQQLHAELG